MKSSKLKAKRAKSIAKTEGRRIEELRAFGELLTIKVADGAAFWRENDNLVISLINSGNWPCSDARFWLRILHSLFASHPG